MKKIFALIVMGILLITSKTKAQTATLLPIAVGDTLTNTDTLSKVLKFTAGYEGVIIQPVVTKLSGTVAGTAYLYQSTNGTNYGSAIDSLVLANVSTAQSAQWFINAPVNVYYKIEFISSGTQSYLPRFYFIARKHD